MKKTTNEKPAAQGDGENFRKWRKAMGYTLEMCARVLEKSPKTVQRYEKGETPIPNSVLLACCFLAIQSESPEKTRRALFRFKRLHGLKGFLGV